MRVQVSEESLIRRDGATLSSEYSVTSLHEEMQRMQRGQFLSYATLPSKEVSLSEVSDGCAAFTFAIFIAV